MCWKSWLATGNKAAISSYKGTIYDSKIQTWYPHTITSRQNSLAIMTAHSTETTKHVCYGCAVKPWLILWNFANGQSEETLEWKISCCTVFILVIVLVIRVSQKQPGFHTSNQHFKSGVGRRRTKGSGGMPLSPLIFTSLVPRPHLSRGKRSGEPSRISWAYYRNVVRTNEIAILSIIT